jgi:Tfp pilus assembly protein PilE
MKFLMTNEKGTTLMELMIYLVISSLIIIAMTSYLVQATRARVALNDQHLVQNDSRVVLEKMTYSLRNAYDVSVSSDNQSVTVFSHNFDDPMRPIITTYIYQSGQLMYGQAIGVPPAEPSMTPLVSSQVVVQNVHFAKVSSSLQVTLALAKNNKTSEVVSTIAFRQK